MTGTAPRKKPKGEDEHPLVLQSDQRRDASPHRAGDGGDRRGPMRGRPPLRVLLATQLFAARLAQRVPLRGRNANCHT